MVGPGSGAVTRLVSEDVGGAVKVGSDVVEVSGAVAVGDAPTEAVGPSVVVVVVVTTTVVAAVDGVGAKVWTDVASG